MSYSRTNSNFVSSTGVSPAMQTYYNRTLLQALEHLIENGKYKEIAANWGLEEGMIDKPVINGAVS